MEVDEDDSEDEEEEDSEEEETPKQVIYYISHVLSLLDFLQKSFSSPCFILLINVKPEPSNKKRAAASASKTPVPAKKKTKTAVAATPQKTQNTGDFFLSFQILILEYHYMFEWMIASRL